MTGVGDSMAAILLDGTGWLRLGEENTTARE